VWPWESRQQLAAVSFPEPRGVVGPRLAKSTELPPRAVVKRKLHEEGKVIPKHAWTSGVVRIERNTSHDIVPGSPMPFQSLLDIGAVVEKVLIEHSILLHPSRKMRKYIAEE
jgi:hypothetical protein